MDTDSFIFEIESDDPYRDLKKYMDFSNFPADSLYYDDSKKGVLGLFKDECAGNYIEKVVALRAKMYTVRQRGNISDIKKSKGIAKSTVKRDIKLEDYEQTLAEKKDMRHNMKTIRSLNHEIKLLSINKKSLSAFDDKRYILDDGIHTLPFGHYSLQKGRSDLEQKNVDSGDSL